ncbi:MAG: OmpH family outer membrane protein [Cytophagaceae bacterium]|nr:MAG: OmpH family outer membrane protein [Cytophagaceae bacterium]
MKFGVVDTGRVLGESKAGRIVSQKLQKINQRWQEQAGMAEQRLEEARARLGKADDKTPMATMFKMQHEVRMMEMGLRHLQESAQADLEAHSDFWQTSLSQTLAGELERIGKKLELSMVYTGPSAQIPYVAEALDITKEVIVEFDKAFKDDL